MSGVRKPPVTAGKIEVSDLLDDILSFGPEKEPPSNDFAERIRQLVKKLQEINQRIDQLSTRF